MNKHHLESEVDRLIGTDQLALAIRKLIDYAKINKLTLHSDLINLLSRLEQTRKSESNGTSTHEDTSRDYNRIRTALAHYKEQIFHDEFHNALAESSLPQHTRRPWYMFLLLLGVLLIGYLVKTSMTATHPDDTSSLVSIDTVEVPVTPPADPSVTNQRQPEAETQAIGGAQNSTIPRKNYTYFAKDVKAKYNFLFINQQGTIDDLGQRIVTSVTGSIFPQVIYVSSETEKFLHQLSKGDRSFISDSKLNEQLDYLYLIQIVDLQSQQTRLNDAGLLIDDLTQIDATASYRYTLYDIGAGGQKIHTKTKHLRADGTKEDEVIRELHASFIKYLVSSLDLN